MLDVGVVIGRFQVPSLTRGHIAVLDGASKHAHTLVLVGVSSQLNKRNPLDFVLRRHMIAELYPNAVILPLIDVPGDDRDWSKLVDSSIDAAFGGGANVTFYVGRDSFLSAYKPNGIHKNFKSVFQVAEEAWSGSTDREIIEAGFGPNSEDYRRGVIYGVLRGLSVMEKK